MEPPGLVREPSGTGGAAYPARPLLQARGARGPCETGTDEGALGGPVFHFLGGGDTQE